MYKIGVVGPRPTVEKIVEVGSGYKNEFEFFPYPYDDIEETELIIRNYNDRVNGWFCSGPSTYKIAKKIIGSDENIVFITPSGSSFYRSLLQMIYYEKKGLEKLS